MKWGTTAGDISSLKTGKEPFFLPGEPNIIPQCPSLVCCQSFFFFGSKISLKYNFLKILNEIILPQYSPFSPNFFCQKLRVLKNSHLESHFSLLAFF
jgi:hypothetical protein